MISINKKTIYDKKQSLVILCSTFKNKADYVLTKEQVSYIENDIKANEKKFVSINDLSRIIFIVLVDEKKDHFTTLESIRKHGANVCEALNASKHKEVCCVNELHNQEYSLSLAEGVTLSNYQFIKHKPSAKKQANTLSNINIVDSKISSSNISNLSIAVDATLKARDLLN
jgi:leucyl aminopeptidase